ncbi:CoA transferase [Candidatus Amarolinea dominans]|uniref:CaiB/BaiF CoA transferase family protein n=1 Tax=Candidatus Amarolinea dominans TaxID=3140696 RepID=UPI001D7E94AB|nr:CoA transferase [Anaerolineae bacterium]
MEQASVLQGIQVLDMTEALAGPLCAMMLGDLGADVLKIERPGSGDMSRGWAPPYVGTESAYFLSTNRNKRSMTLNLKHPAAQAVLHQLVRTADVFVVNQPSLESLRKLATDPDTLWAINPRLVYCAVSGFGLTGPEAGQGGYDVVAQARSGLMALTGEPGSGPMRYPIPLSDATCGVYSVIGILSALRVREQTGRGQLVDMALLDGQVSWLTHVAGPTSPPVSGPAKLATPMRRSSPISPSVRATSTWWWPWAANACGSAFARRLQSNRRSARTPFPHELGSPAAPRRLDSTAGRGVCHARRQLLAGTAAPRTFPAAPSTRWMEALNDPQVVARGMIVEQEHPVVGPVRSVGNPVHLSETPVSYRLPPPSLGQHTVEVLRSLGYADEQIEQLRAEGAA